MHLSGRSNMAGKIDDTRLIEYGDEVDSFTCMLFGQNLNLRILDWPVVLDRNIIIGMKSVDLSLLAPDLAPLLNRKELNQSACRIVCSHRTV